MRRVALLALLALALPMAAFANSLPVIPSFDLNISSLTVGDFIGGNRGCVNVTATSCSTGNYFNGQNINNGTDWVLNLVGPTGRIRLDITNLSPLSGTGHCNMNASNSMGTCNFSGTVMAFGTSVPGGTFTDSISGTLTRGPNDTSTTVPNPWVLTTLTGELGSLSGVVKPDSNLSVVGVQFCRGDSAAQGCGSPGDLGRIRSGFGTGTLDVVTAVPEPGTLALLGTGVIGLAGMARRRFKLGK